MHFWNNRSRDVTHSHRGASSRLRVWLLNRKANAYCVAGRRSRGSFFLSRRLSLDDCLYTSRGPSTLATTTTRTELARREGSLERDHERFDSCWFAFGRLSVPRLSFSLSSRQTRTRRASVQSADAFSLPV